VDPEAWTDRNPNVSPLADSIRPQPAAAPPVGPGLDPADSAPDTEIDPTGPPDTVDPEAWTDRNPDVSPLAESVRTPPQVPLEPFGAPPSYADFPGPPATEPMPERPEFDFDPETDSQPNPETKPYPGTEPSSVDPAGDQDPEADPAEDPGQGGGPETLRSAGVKPPADSGAESAGPPDQEPAPEVDPAQPDQDPESDPAEDSEQGGGPETLRSAGVKPPSESGAELAGTPDQDPAPNSDPPGGGDDPGADTEREPAGPWDQGNAYRHQPVEITDPDADLPSTKDPDELKAPEEQGESDGGAGESPAPEAPSAPPQAESPPNDDSGAQPQSEQSEQQSDQSDDDS
jgi:hypothetical protein